MYAIIATGGKQYKVAEGDIIYVEKLNAATGETVTFDDVVVVNNDKDVLCGDKVANANVKARAKRLSCISTRERPAITRSRDTDSHIQRLKSKLLTLNMAGVFHDSGNSIC